MTTKTSALADMMIYNSYKADGFKGAKKLIKKEHGIKKSRLVKQMVSKAASIWQYGI
jgi:hypothetical protein